MKSRARKRQRTDHDRLFRELLREFFFEFLQLFFPDLAEAMDPGSLDFLDKQVFASLSDGAEYEADLVVKAKFKNSGAYFIVHVENQHTAPRTFPRRFYRYFTMLHEKEDLPVFPIVVYSHDKPRIAQPDVYKIDFPDGNVLTFRYRVVQLNLMSWRRFLKSDNPVASALMAKMDIAAEDRPRVKMECLRLLVTLKLNPARMRLIGFFIDSYLKLNRDETKRFESEVAGTELDLEEKEEVMEMVTSWEREGIKKGLRRGRRDGLRKGLEKGIEKGIERGVEKGVQKGRQEERQDALLETLEIRFGKIPEAAAARIRSITDASDLRALFRQALAATSLAELGL